MQVDLKQSGTMWLGTAVVCGKRLAWFDRTSSQVLRRANKEIAERIAKDALEKLK